PRPRHRPHPPDPRITPFPGAAASPPAAVPEPRLSTRDVARYRTYRPRLPSIAPDGAEPGT
ncbi:ATPase, partial [Mycobacterium tuberculosis]|nr:ATPase [Mycobacterium tuberculosis]